MPRFFVLDFFILLIIISLVSTDDRQITSFASESQHIQYTDPQYAFADSVDPAIAEAREPEGCRFPLKWEGKWFESGEGTDTIISITRSTINIKGRCLESDGEKYLIFNEREYCYRCLVFHEKHYNVLQYKETFCVSERRLIKHFCSTISGDANLHAMFRLDAVPIECPFTGSYTFFYNRGYKDCNHPASNIEPCIQNSRLRFNFQACPDVPGSESKSEELQCLASWREGSFRYLLGFINYNYPASYEEKFRCFIYEKLNKNYSRILSSNVTENDIFSLAQSGDATCNGLSFTEFSRMMTLKKSTNPKFCQFPSWVQTHAQWHTLDQRNVLTFDNNRGLLVYNASDEGSVHSNSVTMTATCSRILENEPSKVMLVLHSTSDCNSGYICSLIYRRDDHIIEIQLGNTARNPEEACHHHYFNETEIPFITLVSSTPQTRQCPNLGTFRVTGLIREGHIFQEDRGVGSLNVGCTSLDTFRIQSEFYNSELNAAYACHGTWEDTGMNYLVATLISPPSITAKRYCFSYKETANSDVLQRLTYSSKSVKFPDTSRQFEESGAPSHENGIVFRFSVASDSCRRNIAPGIHGTFAFDVTKNGSCNEISSASSSPQNFLRTHGTVTLILTGSVLGFSWT